MIAWPLDSNVIRRNSISNTFGTVRRNADGSSRPHQGWDFYAAVGTPCYAIASGTVKHIRTIGDYGNTIILEFLHESDTLYAAYSHLSKIFVKVGDRVYQRQEIGLTGNTGNAKSMMGKNCHLHFELRTTPTPGRGLVGRLSPIHIFGQCPLHKPVGASGEIL